MTRKGPIRKVDKERGEQSCQRGLKEGRDENKIEIVKKERRREECAHMTRGRVRCGEGMCEWKSEVDRENEEIKRVSE